MCPAMVFDSSQGRLRHTPFGLRHSFRYALLPPLLVYPFDQEPQRESYLCNGDGDGDENRGRLVGVCKKKNKTVYQITSPGNREKDTQNPGEVPRLEYQIRQGEDMQGQKGNANDKSVAVRIKEERHQCLQLNRVKGGLIIAADQ